LKILIDTSDYEEYLGPDLEEIIEEISDSALIDEVVHRGITGDLLKKAAAEAKVEMTGLTEKKLEDFTKEELIQKLKEK